MFSWRHIVLKGHSMLGHRHKWPWRENRDSHAWAKVFRIVREFRNLELTFCGKSVPKSWIRIYQEVSPQNLNRGFYMSEHVLLDLLNELRKRDKCEAYWAFCHFRNKFNKFNNTGARMLDSIYHMILKLFLNYFFGVKTLGFCHHFIMFPENL